MKIQGARALAHENAGCGPRTVPDMELAALTMAAVLDEIEQALRHPHHDAYVILENVRSIMNGERP